VTVIESSDFVNYLAPGAQNNGNTPNNADEITPDSAESDINENPLAVSSRRTNIAYRYPYGFDLPRVRQRFLLPTASSSPNGIAERGSTVIRVRFTVAILKRKPPDVKRKPCTEEQILREFPSFSQATIEICSARG
jgi:hypothetical protein